MNDILSKDPQGADETDLISKGAPVFRSKLISDFHLLETFSEHGSRVEAPAFYTSDILNESKMTQMMLRNPNGLVRFQVYHNKDKKTVSYADRRRNRVTNKNSRIPPIDLWAHWIVKSAIFQNVIVFLIFANIVVLGLQAQYNDNIDPRYDKLKLILEIFDMCTLLMFSLEIILKWTDSFKSFWKNKWNIFDFLVTFVTLIPELITISTGQFGQRTQEDISGFNLAAVAGNLRTFRVFRSLKMVSRFQKVRLIILAISKAFKAMVFILILFIIFMFLFAIMGVMFFREAYKTYPGRDTLWHAESFSGVPNAVITLWQLFTLDRWIKVLGDLINCYGAAASIYIILWILIGSFIFRNIFVGIMVNNFQSIRHDLFQEVEEIQEAERRDEEMQAFTEELHHHQHTRSGHNLNDLATPDSESNLGRRLSVFHSAHEVQDALSQTILKGEKEGLEWQGLVERNLANLGGEESQTCWPKDSLFRYFLMMEALQENLEERREILNLLVEALVQLHDR